MIEYLYTSDNIEAALRSSNITNLKSESIAALYLFKNQLANDNVIKVTDISKSTYRLWTYEEYKYYLNSNLYHYKLINDRDYVIFKDEDEFIQALTAVNPTKQYTWKRLYSDSDPGYEVTSRGDRRFSPFFMIIYDEKLQRNISLEDYWKIYIKPLPFELKRGTAHKIFRTYLNTHKGLFYELAQIGLDRNLTDMFDVNGGQNLTYCDLLNEYYKL